MESAEHLKWHLRRDLCTRAIRKGAGRVIVSGCPRPFEDIYFLIDRFDVVQ